MKPLTVIHVSTESGFRGGERQVRLLTDGLAARGHRCVVACPPGSALLEDRRLVGMGTPLASRGEFDLLAARRLAGMVRAERADLLHAHTSHAHALVWLAGLMAGVPAVVSRRVDFPVGGNPLSRLKYHGRGIHYIAISDGVRRVLEAGGIPGNRIAVVHSGVDPSRYEPRGAARDESEAGQWGATRGVPLLVNVAALVDHKDHATLLRAAAVLRDRGVAFRLVVAGSGVLENELRALCHDLALDERVAFVGHVADLRPLFRAADVFVLSSHLEGLCTSILDAMLAGLPVVATRTGGVPEIVMDGRTGLLVPPRAPEALASAIGRMLADTDLRLGLAAAGREHVLSDFTATRMVEGTEAAYGRILASPAST